VLIKAIILHLSFHLRVSQILYKKMDDLYDLEETNHRLLLLFNIEKPLEEASEGAWTKLSKELKKIKL